MKALVSIITVNYNGLRDTCEMIDSFRNHETYPHYEIIVVDNGSRLPEAEEIQERYRSNLVPGGSLSGSPASDNPASFPPVKVVRNINNGFAGGNNAGLKAAGGDYLFSSTTTRSSKNRYWMRWYDAWSATRNVTAAYRPC